MSGSLTLLIGLSRMLPSNACKIENEYLTVKSGVTSMTLSNQELHRE